MRRTLKVLGLIGVAVAAGTAVLRRAPAPIGPVPCLPELPSTLSQELRQALNRFEDLFGT